MVGIKHILWLGLIIAAAAAAQQPIPAWLEKATNTVQDYTKCMATDKTAGACQAHLSDLLQTVYSLADFNHEVPLSPEEIAGQINSSPNWTRIGLATDQAVLTKAQEAANQGQAVLAVIAFNPIGHVAIVLPGQLQRSNQWTLNAPNSASLFRNKPQLSYINKKLSYAFAKPDSVLLYSRNKTETEAEAEAEAEAE